MRRAAQLVNERAKRRLDRKRAIPQWLADLRDQPTTQRRARIEAKLRDQAQRDSALSDLAELIVLLLEESALGD